MKALGLAFAALLVAAAAHGETHRVAIVVGNNRGAGDRPSLSFAEDDAVKVGAAMVELGGIEPGDLFLLRGQSAAVLREAMARVRERVSGWHATSGTSVVLIFFFSGHSDGESLELGADRVPFKEVRQWLSGAGADMRLAIVDSCKSGALLAAKGGRSGPAFAIRLTDDVASTGEALLTSSAADELALESREIGGSFFTHHLVSGLRGAADRSGDGRVTLAEAYDYAFAHTVSATAETLVGPQHPEHDYRVSGEGDLVLTDLTTRTSVLQLPRGFDRILVQSARSHEVLAEIPGGTITRVAVPAGRYDLRGWRGERVLLARVEVARSGSSPVAAEEFHPIDATPTIVKGGAIRRSPGVTFLLGAGVQAGASSTVHEQGMVAVGARGPRASGWSATLTAATARGDAFWETDAFLTAGWRLGIERGRWRGHVTLEAGAGLVSQNLDRGTALQTPAVIALPRLGTSLRLSEKIALALEAQLLTGWIRKDDRNALLLLPGLTLGLLWTP